MTYEQSKVVWIDGQAYAPNHPKAKAQCVAVARLGSPESKPAHTSPALDKDVSRSPTRKESLGCFHILIVRYGRKQLGSDVLPFAYKSVRDEIVVKLLGGKTGELDDDPRLTWAYDQIISKTIGTHVLISLTK